MIIAIHLTGKVRKALHTSIYMKSFYAAKELLSKRCLHGILKAFCIVWASGSGSKSLSRSKLFSHMLVKRAERRHA
jgi:hypothetical protein